MALASQLSAATKLARSTIYQWCHENYVPHLKLGIVSASGRLT